MTSFEFNSSLVELKINLHRFAMRLTYDRDDAQDLVQDTYLKAITHKDKFTDNSNLKAWLFTIMKNTFINNYRHKIKENTIIEGTKDLYYINMTQERGSDSLESNYYEGEIEKAIDNLSAELRNPFRMHLAGYKYQEIAVKLSINIGTVKSRIFHTRKKLMRTLKDFVR